MEFKIESNKRRSCHDKCITGCLTTKNSKAKYINSRFANFNNKDMYLQNVSKPCQDYYVQYLKKTKSLNSVRLKSKSKEKAKLINKLTTKFRKSNHSPNPICLAKLSSSRIINPKIRKHASLESKRILSNRESNNKSRIEQKFVNFNNCIRNKVKSLSMVINEDLNLKKKNDFNLATKEEQIEELTKFNTCFHNVLRQIDNENCGILNYKKAVDILTRLGFMHFPLSNRTHNVQKERQLLFDIWRILKGNNSNGVNARNFKLFLLAIMRFNFSWMKRSKDINEICLSIAKTEKFKAELKNVSSSKNNLTLDNLSSIKQDIITPIVNMKEK